MSYIDDLNAELGLGGEETPAIGSPKLTEKTLEEADLPEIVAESNPLAPPTEVPVSTSPGIPRIPGSITQAALTPPPAPTPEGPGPIYKTALATLGKSASAPENPIDRANIEFGFTTPPPVPGKMQEDPIEKANRELGVPPSVKYGDTRDTQEPGFLMPSYYDTDVPTQVDKPQKGIITEALHAPIYGVAQLGQVAAGLVAVAGGALNNDAITEAARGMYDKATKIMEPFAPTVSDIRQIGGVGDFTRWAVSSIGQMLPFMIGTMGAGAAVKTIITKTFGKAIAEKAATAAVARGLADLSVKSAAKDALIDLGVKAGYAGMAASSVGAELGIIASDRLTNGAKVLSADLLWAIPAGFLDVLPEWRLAGKMGLFGKKIADIASKEGLDAAKSSFIKEFAKQGFMEGITEGWQEILEEAGAGRKPFTYDTMWQAINAFMAAGLSGGVLGAGTNLLTRAPTQTTAPSGSQEKFGPPTVPLVGPEFGGPQFRPELAEIGKRVYAPEQLKLPGAQGFNLVNEPSILRKAWNIPPESTPEIFTKQEEGRYRPVGQGPVEVMTGQAGIDRYQDMLKPTKGETFVTEPATPPVIETTTRGAQDLFNSEEWAPLRDYWNKVVMGTPNVPQIAWGGQFPQHLLYDERQGARGFQSPWVDMEITGAGHVIFKDFDGGQLEALFDKGIKTGTEFVPIRYVDPSGNGTILRRGEPLPQSLMDTINTFNAVRNRALGGPATLAETPPPQLTTGTPPGPAAITPPKVEGLTYAGVQKIPGQPDQYAFTEKNTGSTFYTKDLSTENLMRERNRVRKATALPTINLGEAIDKDLAFDILQGVRKQGKAPQLILPIRPPRLTPASPSGKIAPMTTELVGGETKSGAEISAPELNVPTKRDVEMSAPAGSNITTPSVTYKDGKSTGNVWVRQTLEPSNSERTLLVQFSTNLINPIEKSKGLDKIYYDKLYSGTRDGYIHPEDFWEIPDWISVASNSIPNADVYVIRNIDEAVKFFNEARYGKIAFSALDVNAGMIADIVSRYKGQIAIGGYVDLTKHFGKFENVKTYDDIGKFVRDQGFKFIPGTNYRHFQGSEVIPRLGLSTGCLFKCTFCDVKPHGKVVEASPESIRRQVESIKQLKPKLVYLNDKTFGQGKNFDVLGEVYTELKNDNPDFNGFVIQTTATQFNKLSDNFVKNSGIKYVELGVETFNDNLLREYRKPHTTDDILKAFQRARDLNVLVIPNVVIGLKGENSTSYNNTLNFLNASQDIISHVNAYNLAVYAGTDLAESIGPLEPGDMNENIAAKSWIKDPAATQEFSDKLFTFATRQLDKSPAQLEQMRTTPAPALSPVPDRIPGFLRHVVALTPEGTISLKATSFDTMAEEAHAVKDRLGRIVMPFNTGQLPYGAIGEVWVGIQKDEHGMDRMMVYSDAMYNRLRRGEDVKGIPFESVDGIKAEGWRAALARVNPKFNLSEQRADELGPIFYSQAERVIDQKMSIEAARQVIKDMGLKIPNGVVDFQILNVPDDIPYEVSKNFSTQPGAHTKGAFLRGEQIPTIYIFAGNIPSERELYKTVFHELIGHLGFEKLVGPTRLQFITKMVHELYSYEDLAYLYRRYGVGPGTKDGDYTVALEKIAEIAEPGGNATLWQRFVVWFKEVMADIFGVDAAGKLTEDEIRVYLWRSRELLQQENVHSMAQTYNSMTKLISMRMWNMELPDGPAGVSSFMREDSSPSNVDAAENFSGWRSWFQAHRDKNKNFGAGPLKDLGVVEAIGSLPHWVSMKFPSFKAIVQVQWDRQDKRNKDRLHLLQDPNTNSGDNPYISRKNTEGVDRVITWSDQNDFYLESDEQLQSKFRELNGRDPVIEETQAYRGWKGGFDRAVDYAISKLRESALKLYSDQPWYEQFKGVINNTIDPATVQLDPDQLKEFKKAITRTSERMARIDERETQLKSMNFYAPHVRGKGEYVVRVKDTDAEGKQVRVWVERFENATEAEKARVRLAKDYTGLLVEKTYEPKTTEFVYGGLDVPAMEAFLEGAMEKAKGKFGVDDAAADKFLNVVFKAIDEEIMARGFRQHYIHRHRGNVIGGYRTEGLHQVFFDYMSGLAGSMTKLDATYDFHKALQSIDKVNERGLYEYATRYVKDMLRNSDIMDRRLNAFKTLPYAWYLTANLRLAVTQMFQNGVTAYPILSRLQQEAGIKGSAGARLATAMTDIARGNITGDETKMLQNAYEQGETMANYIQEIKGKIEGGWAKTYFMKLMDVASIPFAGMERFNRRTSLLAAFRLYTEAGRSYDEAYELAKEFVRDAHYAYGLSNFPQLLRDGTPFSKIAGMAYVFKSFPHNYVLSMLHFAKDKDGKLALGVMMRSVAMLAILGGLASIPFLDDILEEYEQMTGDPVRSKMRKTLQIYGGNLLAQTGMEGLPALAGVDMSGSVKMSIPIPGVGEFDPSTFTMGVWGGLIDKGKKALDFASNSQWSRAIEAGAPVGVEMMMKAARLSQEGLKTAGERQILDVTGKPIMPTLYETGAQIAGFRPERVAEIQKERRVSQNIEDRFTKERQNLSKRLRMAQGSPKEIESVKKDIQTYNLRVMKYGGVIPRISPDSLLSGFKPETGYMKYERARERL